VVWSGILRERLRENEFTFRFYVIFDFTLFSIDKVSREREREKEREILSNILLHIRVKQIRNEHTYTHIMEKQLQRWEENRFSGKTDKYWYTQTESSLCVRVPIPRKEKLQSKDLDVDIKAKSLCIKMKNETIIQGKFAREFVGAGKPLGENRKVNVEDSLWTLEDGVIAIELEKRKSEFWPNFLDGETKIKD
jgi:hypothetical protein